jgi:Uma2 family endonuclease
MTSSSSSLRWTSADLEAMPEDGKRREIIDGELYVATQPTFFHQFTCMQVGAELRDWSRSGGHGQAVGSPGLVFAEDDDVAPDVVWISDEQLARALDDRGHFRLAPELVVEVLSPGANNERRDREIKRKLYSRRGVREYWICDPRAFSVEVWRHQGEGLELAATLAGSDVLTSPLLPGFAVAVETLFYTPRPG